MLVRGQRWSSSSCSELRQVESLQNGDRLPTNVASRSSHACLVTGQFWVTVIQTEWFNHSVWITVFAFWSSVKHKFNQERPEFRQPCFIKLSTFNEQTDSAISSLQRVHNKYGIWKWGKSESRFFKADKRSALIALTLQDVAALQLLHGRPLAQSPAEKHQDYVLDHLLSPALLNFPSSLFSLFDSKSLSKLQPAPKCAHPVAERPELRSQTRIILVLQHLKLHIGEKKTGRAFKITLWEKEKYPERFKEDKKVRREAQSWWWWWWWALPLRAERALLRTLEARGGTEEEIPHTRTHAPKHIKEPCCKAVSLQTNLHISPILLTSLCCWFFFLYNFVVTQATPAGLTHEPVEDTHTHTSPPHKHAVCKHTDSQPLNLQRSCQERVWLQKISEGKYIRF